MKYLIVVVIASSLCWGWDQHQSQHQTQTVNSNNTVSNSHNNTSTSSATGGNAVAGGGGGAAVSDNVPRLVAPAYAPPPIGDCTSSVGRGGASPYFGVSWGSHSIDHDCQIEKVAEGYAAAGAWKSFCKVKASQKISKDAGATFEDCMEAHQPVATLEPTPTMPVPEPTVAIPAPSIPWDAIGKRLIVLEAPVAVSAPPVKKHYQGKPCVVPEAGAQ